jgi:hypothetical protein
MGRTFIRQLTQIAESDTYDDTVVPSLANYETNAANIENDLNNLRSRCQDLINRNGAAMPAGNWYDLITQPTTLENGTIRGIDATNAALHLVEKKRVLRDVTNVGTDVTVPACADATGILTLSANVNNNDTVTTGTKTYTFETSLTDVDGNVLIGATASDSIDNLIAAITLGAGSGTLYAASTTANTFITAAAGAGDTMDAEALLGGTAGNLIATTESTATVRMSWGAATLTGGTGDMVILTLAQLPVNTTSAVGSVTTLGTVTAYNANFGTADLAEVTGPDALSPKNLVRLVDHTTGDPILSSGRVVYGLLQVETVTDGDTMTGTTPHRAQITFVRPNADFTDLEFCPSADITGKEVHWASRERVRLEDLNEYDFLTGAVIDIGGGAITINRQVSYDNQGTTPVDVTTNSYLDLEGASLEWQIRDDAEAILFRVIEGSSGGTSKVAIEDDVDEFDVDAVVSDFLNGIKVDTGAAGTTLNIGVTANQIDSGGALTVASGGSGDLILTAANEMLLSDVNNSGSTWTATHVKLSETTAEWDAYEAAFGGEVSLMNAIVQASDKAARVKGYATLQNDVAADTDVDATTSSNLDVDLPDYSGVGTFVDDCDVYLNGELLRNGANAAANHDVYPGTTPAQGMLKFEFALKGTGSKPDQLCMIVWGS